MLGLATSGLARRTSTARSPPSPERIVVGWAVVPLLFFGVDETLDPARFALLPMRRMTLARGMLAAAFVGVPAVVTLVGSGGLVIAAGIRFGPLEAGVGLVGVMLGLTVGVVASRALTSAFAALLRSRRMRDLAAVVIAVLASSIGPLQLLVVSQAGQGTVDRAMAVARVLGWTPLGAPYLLPFDVAAGDWAAAAARLALTVVAIAVLLWWWSYTIESAMIGWSSAGVSAGTRATAASAVKALISPVIRGVARPTVFGAVVACEWRLWWRDARRRASLISILMASALLPIALNFAGNESGQGIGVLPFSFAIAMAGTMGGMLLGNQFAFDGSAYASHLLSQVPGRVDLRARATAIGLVAVPVQLAVVIAVSLLTGNVSALPAGVGLLVAAFGAAVATAGMLSVLAPYPLPENSNPFTLNQGGASAKGLLAVVAMIGLVERSRNR
jgi:ABC-2 type transport system permease protein